MKNKTYVDAYNRASKVIASDKSINPHLHQLLYKQLAIAFSSCVELVNMDLSIENDGDDLLIAINAVCANQKHARILPE